MTDVAWDVERDLLPEVEACGIDALDDVDGTATGGGVGR